MKSKSRKEEERRVHHIIIQHPNASLMEDMNSDPSLLEPIVCLHLKNAGLEDRRIRGGCFQV